MIKIQSSKGLISDPEYEAQVQRYPLLFNHIATQPANHSVNKSIIQSMGDTFLCVCFQVEQQLIELMPKSKTAA